MTTDDTASAAAPERDPDAADQSPDAAQALPATVEELQAELQAARQGHARALADYQNLQRRSAEERREYAGYTLASVVLNFIPILDDLDRALDSVDADLADHPWLEGVQLVKQKFDAVLEAAGVTEIAAHGETFDPNVHDAMGYVPGPEGRVVHQLERGYAIGERVVRPARVMVGDGSTAHDSPNEPASGSD